MEAVQVPPEERPLAEAVPDIHEQMVMAQPAAPVISDYDLNKYTKGRILLRLLGLRKTYTHHFEEEFGRELPGFETAARELAPENPQALVRGRDAILRIGGYQVWAWVLYDWVLYKRIRRLALFVTGLLSVGGAFYLLRGPSLRTVALYAIVATAVAFGTLGTARATAKVSIPSSAQWRTLLGVLGLVVLAGGAWLLWQWVTAWGRVLFVGVAAAVVVSLLIGLWVQMRQLACAAILRYSWTRHTAKEIIESLADAKWALDETLDPRKTIWARFYAADGLDHVATCVERYLPAYLTKTLGEDDRNLREHVRLRCQGMAATVRDLAVECLLPVAATGSRIGQQVSGLLVTAAQGQWGTWAWNSAPMNKEPKAPRWRRWVATVFRIMLSLLLIVAVIALGIYLYRTDRLKMLLDAQILGPILVVAFGFLTTLLARWLNPRSGEQLGKPTSPSDIARVS